MTGTDDDPAIAEAIKASGAIVRVEPGDFARVLTRQDAPLVIFAQGGIFGARLQYLTSYKGFVLFVKTSESLHLPDDTEVIHAQKIWIPG
jgi:hypothetical protein